MDWVLPCNEPKRVCWGPHRLLNFLQRAPGRLDRMLAQHRWFLEPGPAGLRPTRIGQTIRDDQGGRARAQVILRVDQFRATVARDKYHFRCSSRVSSKFRSATARLNSALP